MDCLIVVNCFHFSVSLGYKTTFIDKNDDFVVLWIAFIFQYLWDTKQHIYARPTAIFCCELLSFFSIFGIQNNYAFFKNSTFYVVNCFHFSVSLGYKTTIENPLKDKKQLWIAFIFQYLWDTKQLWWYCTLQQTSCELLSFFSIFGIQNNKPKQPPKPKSVVNCFHFSVSLGYKTTFT